MPLRFGQDDPHWQKEMLLEVDRIRQYYGARYIHIERDDPYGDHNDIECFIRTVEDPEPCDRSWRAIQGRGASRYFKDVLCCTTIQMCESDG